MGARQLKIKMSPLKETPGLDPGPGRMCGKADEIMKFK